MAYGSVNVPGALPHKQDLLAGHPGQVVGFDGMGLAYAVRGWSNRNLLDNAYWAIRDAIINQRGQEEYAGQNTYAIDRWYLRDVGGVKLTENGLLLSDSGICGIGQVIDPEISRWLVNKKLTLSLLTASGEFAAATCVVPPSGTFQAPAATTASGHCDAFVYRYEKNHGGNLQVLLYGNLDAVAAIKLELGTQQTLAHQDADGNWVLNDPPPNRALELAKCQRYQINLVDHESKNYGLIGTGYGVNATRAVIGIPLPVTLRTSPSLIYSGEIIIKSGTDDISNASLPKSISNSTMTSNILAVNVDFNEAIVTPGTMYQLWYRAAKAQNNMFILDCNL